MDRIKISNVYHGQLEGTAYQVVAETAKGEVFIHPCDISSEDRAELFVEQVRAKGDIDPEIWLFWRVIYGSDAFIEEEREAAMAADTVRAGLARLEDLPTNLRTLL